MPSFRFFLPRCGVAGLAALFLAPFSSAWAVDAGRVDFATGDVRAVTADGRTRAIAKGAVFESGETIETGSNGRAQLRFTDGAQISLQPQSEFRVDDYRFSGQADGKEKGFFSLLKGGMRTITGLIGRSPTHRENYKVTTSVATIGIRGTEYSVSYGNSITVTTGEGIIEICNAAGCLILNSGETAFVPDGNTIPLMTDKKVDLPPAPPENLTLVEASRTTETPTDFDLPTPASEINALTGEYQYSLVSASQATSGSFTADFTNSLVNFQLTLPSGTLSGDDGTINGSGFSGDSGDLQWNSSTVSGSFSGSFVGTNASGVIMTYDTDATGSGSATFGSPSSTTTGP